jgi:hypothetical protein
MPKRVVERVRGVVLAPAEALERVGRVEGRPVVAERATGVLAVQG